MFCYSPYPMMRYRIAALPDCEVSVIAATMKPVAPAVWNLFWLSNPKLDNLPEATGPWHKAYQVTPGLLASIVTDVRGDEVLFRKLMMHPQRFIDWFERDDHSIYEVYGLLGQGWAETVLTRADDAAMRMAGTLPRVYADNSGIKIDWSKVSR